MMRFFKIEVTHHLTLRDAVTAALGQPNESARAPWGENGDFTTGERVYIAFGPYHNRKFANLIGQFENSPGVEEISNSDYHAAMPQGGGL